MKNVVFGMNVRIDAVPGSDPLGIACSAEGAGFDFVSLNDHPGGGGPVYEAWTLLSWIAARTKTISVAPRVLAAPLRLPAIVAQSGATLDRLSGGRMILALGSGGSPEELEALGAPAEARRASTTALEDSLRIIRGLWDEGESSFQGGVYGAHLRLEPPPDRHIPIWLGTFGRRGLRLAGALADGWIPSLGHVSEDELFSMRERVIEAALAAGRDESHIRCVLNLRLRLGAASDDDQGLVSGEASQVVDRLLGFVEKGFRGFNFVLEARDGEANRQLETLAVEVIPSVVAAGEKILAPR